MQIHTASNFHHSIRSITIGCMENMYRDRMRKRMKELRITQVALAEKLGLTQGAVSKWMRGDGNPSEDTWERVAAALSMDVAYLRYGVGGNEKVADLIRMIGDIDENGVDLLISMASQLRSKK